MFSQLAQQNNELGFLHRSGLEFDRSVDRSSAGSDAVVIVGSMTDSYLQC